MGVACGFGQAVARGAAQGVVDRRRQAHPMADRYVHRADPGPCTQHGTDRFTLVAQRHPPALVGRQRVMAADQPRLGNPDAGNIRQYPQMAGQPEAARMGQALAVTQDEVRQRGEPVQRFQYRGQFAKRQVAGDVRKARRAAADGLRKAISVGAYAFALNALDS